LTQVLATLAVLAEGSLTQASIQTLSQPFSGWMSKRALPVWRRGTHRSRHSKSMDSTSLNRYFM